MRKPRTRYWAEAIDDGVYAVQAVRDYGEGFTGAVWLLAGSEDWQDLKAKLDKMLTRRERLIMGICFDRRWPRSMGERFDWVDRPNGEPNPIEVREPVERLARASDAIGGVPWSWIYWEESAS